MIGLAASTAFIVDPVHPMDAEREQQLLLQQVSLLEEKASLLEEHLRLQKLLTGGQEIELSRLRAENELLRQRLDLVLRKVFGTKSEALDPAQLELLLREDGDDAAKKASAAAGADAPPAADEPTAAAPAKTRAARTPRDLSRLEVRERLDIPAAVRANPDAFREIARVHTDRLDYQPEVIFIERTVRPVFQHRDDPDAVPLKAPAPPALRPGLSATTRLLAHVLVSKYCDHLPFYRQESILRRRHGVEIPRHTLCRWADIAADALEPLQKHLHAGLLEKSYLQADETPVRYLVPGRGKCATGYLWVLHAPGPAGAKGDVLFQWHPDRRAANLVELLGDDYAGILQTDGYAAYDSHAATRPGITLAACWAHARRKFHEAFKTGQTLAAAPLQTIQRLYRIETGLRASRAGPDETKEVRQARAAPLLEALKPALLDLRRHPQVLPKSPLGKAIDYTLALWHRLAVYTADGRVEIDTNLIENAIRPTAVGKKNWLFVGGEDTGQRSAILYTFIEGARRHGHDPAVYLADVLDRLARMTTRDDLGALLPSRWQSPAAEAARCA
jgi:transposase